MRNLFALILMFQFILLIAQAPGNTFQHDITEKYYPQTPSERSFEKFTNIPEGNYTGVHGFSVPIFTIQGSDFNFPISIDYSGGGIKVDEISGTVGLGWNLNVGGISLSQEVRGKIDDDNNSNGGIIIDDPINFDPNGADKLKALDMVGQILGIAYGSCVVLISGADSKNEVNPDYFSYSLLNDSGKFILDSAGNIHTIPKDDVTFIDKLNLIDSKGIKYEFGRYKSSNTIYHVDQTSFSYSYKIKRIILPHGDEIVFNYTPNNYSYISNYEFVQDVQTHSLNASTGYIVKEMEKSPYRTTVQEEVISSIEYKNTLIKFVYSTTGREDVNGGVVLRNIEVNHKTPSDALQLRKNYQLTTDYFRSNSGNVSSLFSNSQYPISQYTNRLRLKSVEELLSGSKYSFTYYGEKTATGNGNNVDLPHRFSYSVDNWGVYNGEINNSPIESFITIAPNTTPIRYEVNWGGKKMPNIDYAINGNLKSVLLPTGGKQEFEYELDEYYNENEYTVENHFFKREHNISESFWYNNGNNPYHSSNWIPFAPLEVPDSLGYDFRDGFDYRIKFIINPAPLPQLNPDELPQSEYYTFRIVDDATGIPIDPQNFVYTNDTRKFPPLNPDKNYRIEIKYVQHDTPIYEQAHISVSFKLTWAQNNPKSYKNKNAGSLRTKSISLFENETDTIAQLKKEYNYINFQDSTRLTSGGVYMGSGLPSFVMSSKPCIEQNQNPGCNAPEYCEFKTYFRSPNHLNLNAVYGKSVYYENVTERHINNKNTSESFEEEYEFQVPNILLGAENPDINKPRIYMPHNEYTGGFLLRKRKFNHDGIKVHAIQNIFQSDYYFNLESADYLGGNDRQFAIAFGLTTSITGSNTCMGSSGECLLEYHFGSEDNPYYNFYYITSSWIKLLETKEETYENGLLKMTNFTHYEYDNTYTHLNPVRVESTDSLGQEIKTEYKYNHPYKKDEPTTIVKYENGNPISVQKTTFNLDDLPQYVFAKRGATTLDDSPPSDDLKITYEQYDINGNLQQYRLADGTPVSIIWGYNGQYPIAKVEGVAYSAISTLRLTNVLNASNADVDGTTENSLRARLQELRMDQTVSSALVTTYTYDPLIGVTSITAPNGQTEYYKYDSAGRIEEVYIMEGGIKRVMKKSKYHYFNQP